MMSSLLISTVGGSPEPVVASLKEVKPGRVFFVASRDTVEQVEAKIVPAATREGVTLTHGQYDLVCLTDAQDFSECVKKIRDLDQSVRKWIERGENFEVFVDFTGGTKCMTAALALVAHRWRCRFLYVGGSERTHGIGVVVSGKEYVLNSPNPWDVLGYEAAESAVTLFDQQDYAAAARVLENAIRKVQEPAAKRELSTLKSFVEGYAVWDRFEHRKAFNVLDDIRKNANDLRHLFGNEAADSLVETVRKHQEFLQLLMGTQAIGANHIKDLLANARRRAQEGRYDDAVARLYRCVEAMAQIRLREEHGISDTGSVQLDEVPEPLRSAWAPHARGRVLRLGLQDDYELLKALGDELGLRFEEVGLADASASPLVTRNQSILGHGSQPVGRTAFEQLWTVALQLSMAQESDLPCFPHLGQRG